MIVEVLDGDFVIDGEGGGGSGALAKDHEDGFHADGAVGDVGAGDGDGYEEVLALLFLGGDGAVGDVVGLTGSLADVAFVLDVAFGGDVALDVVGVHGVGAHADGLGWDAFAEDVELGGDVGADHAAGFADVELVRPVSVVSEFVFGEAPGAHFFAEFLGDAGIVGEEIHHALLVGFVLFDNLAATFVGAIGVVVVHADVVGVEGAVVVGVGFVIGEVVELLEDFIPTGGEDAGVEFVLGGVVAGGFWKGDAVLGFVGEAHAEAVGLDLVVAFAFFTGFLG